MESAQQPTELQIAESARKHGVADEDIRHAVRNAIVTVEQDDSLILYIGPARDARLLEVVVVDSKNTAIHAMELRESLRKKYLPEPETKKNRR